MAGEGGERAPKATVSLRQVKKMSADVEHDDDVKSRFTEYSMTSSILPRSEGTFVHMYGACSSTPSSVMKVQDDRFEKFFEEVSRMKRQTAPFMRGCTLVRQRSDWRFVGRRRCSRGQERHRYAHPTSPALCTHDPKQLISRRSSAST